MSLLYVSYDGVLEPLGESQVVAYLERLAGDPQPILLSFEKPKDLRAADRLGRMAVRLRTAGVSWMPLRYHKRPPILSTLWDVFRGVVAALRLRRSRRVTLVHARGYVPALIALSLKVLTGSKFLFDMRGFWADEKVDGGHWRRDGWIYAATKWCERRFYERADAIVSLTHEGVKAIPDLGYRIPPETPILVIPTCADLDRFAPGPRDEALAARLGLTGRRVVGCVGTMHNWYLRQPMLDYLACLAAWDPTLQVLIVTRDHHDALRRDAVAAGVPADRLVLTEAPFSAMPAYIRLMDAGLFFIKVCFSKRGSAATKLAEFLGCGVPVIINDGVGDSGWIVRESRVGVVLPDTRPEDFAASLPDVERLLADPHRAARCRETARRHFALDTGVRRYADLYARLASGPQASVARHA